MNPALALEISALAQQRSIDEAAARGDSAVQRWYAGATVLLTGGSGFLGKQLMEKLLRTCDIEKVYMLLRTKKGKAPKDRLLEVLSDPVFDKVRQMQPNFADKIAVVEGDVTEIRLGIDDQAWNTITEEVTVIFHGAATTRFNDPLRHATLTNVRGTREVLRLAKACKNLKSLVHVSTAFSHATKSKLESRVLEQFYGSPVPPDLMIDMAETMDEATLNAITPQLLQGEWINTYTFTKVIAEEAVRQLAGEMPVCIVRPAIVICAYREPTPGWLDLSCAYGPTGIPLGSGLGLIHTVLANDDTRIDLVPVDLVNNAVVAAAWQTAQAGARAEPVIYTVTGTRNPFEWYEIITTLRKINKVIASPKAVWYAEAISTNNTFVFWLLYWLFHMIPAYVIDGVGLIMGKKLRAVYLYTKAYKMFLILSPFTLNHWDFNDTNLQSLQKCLSPTDRQIFNFDVTIIDWKQFLTMWSLGIRKYMIKDGLKDSDYAVKKQYWLRIVNYIAVALYAYLWWNVIYYAFSLTRYTLSFVL